MPATDLPSFLELARSRRAARHYLPTPIPPSQLEDLLDAARWAPSGYNLQPTHFIVVSDAERRAALRTACFDQRQITDAPTTVVFAGDRRVMHSHFDKTLACDLRAGAVTPAYERLLRKFVPMAFGTGPMGLGWLAKATFMPLLGWIRPVPSIPAVHRRYWLAKQVSLASMNFMLAAKAAGLHTCPMEGFDERRVRRVLGLPRTMVPVVLVPVGLPAGDEMVKSRLPLTDLVHRERWGARWEARSGMRSGAPS